MVVRLKVGGLEGFGRVLEGLRETWGCNLPRVYWRGVGWVRVVCDLECVRWVLEWWLVVGW